MLFDPEWLDVSYPRNSVATFIYNRVADKTFPTSVFLPAL